MFRGKSLYSKFLLAVPAIAVSLPAFAVDEIIVTAERIEANLQEVPMAVTALSAADLETNNITSTMELTKTVPGMVYRRNTGTASASNVYIRGFGDDESRLTDPTTGLYIDGVYVGRPYGSLVELIDAGSVEVLRGPQGTLYGRNTIAGAIKINSADRGENGGNFAVSVGDEGYRKVKGGFSYGINDSSGIIFSALHEESDGYVNAGAFGKQGGKDVTAVRVAYDKEFGNDWSLKISADLVEDDSDPTPATTRGTYTTPAASSREYIDNTESSGLTVALNGPVGEWDMSVLYGNRSIENFLDSHISARYTQIMDQTQDSLEVSGNRDFGMVNVTAGLYYMEEQYDFEYDFFGFSIYGATFDSETEQTAAFVNAKWSLSDQLMLTTGLRTMQEDRYLSVTNTNSLQIAGTGAYNCGFGIGPSCPAALGQYDLDFDREDYRLALDYQISDDLMIYVSHSTGSRTGGWSSDNLAPVDEEELETTEIGIRSVIGGIRFNLTYFDSVLEGFQTGVSSSGAFGRSNADEAEFKGLELEFGGNLTDSLSFNGYITTLDAEYTELSVGQAQGFLGGNAADRQAACPAAGADFTANGPIWQQCAYGLNIKGAPEMTWSLGLQYAVNDAITIDLQGYGADETDNLTGNPAYARTDTYDKYDIGITYDDEDSPYRIKFWGKNITDQHEVANGTGGLVYMYNPRHYGMTVSAKF